MGVAYVGIGSNIGDVFGNCLKGIEEVLSDERAHFAALSSFYRTSPVSPVPQDDFLNCVLKLAWDASPPELLALLLSVERRQGRTREVALGPRTLDLDVLLFDALILDTPDLTIPHPRLHERKFALIPCLEIDPGLVHPRLKHPLAEFVRQIGDEQRVELEKTVSKEEMLRRMDRDKRPGPMA
jgi:2-amino-4-hydroxy-6-hydroxymethyldihydropteridine diphosphokinase